jgi:hypothetical protein
MSGYTNDAAMEAGQRAAYVGLRLVRQCLAAVERGIIIVIVIV